MGDARHGRGRTGVAGLVELALASSPAAMPGALAGGAPRAGDVREHGPCRAEGRQGRDRRPHGPRAHPTDPGRSAGGVRHEDGDDRPGGASERLVGGATPGAVGIRSHPGRSPAPGRSSTGRRWPGSGDGTGAAARAAGRRGRGDATTCSPRARTLGGGPPARARTGGRRAPAGACGPGSRGPDRTGSDDGRPSLPDRRSSRSADSCRRQWGD